MSDANEQSQRVLDDYWMALQRTGGRLTAERWVHEFAQVSEEDLESLRFVQKVYDTRRAAELDSTLSYSSRAASFEDLLKPGTLVDSRYTVIDLLGRGGMGEVYLVWHESLGAVRALKLLPVHVADSVQAVQRFQREVRILANFQPQPNLVFASDAGLHEGRPYLVMEYVSGKDLKAYVEEKGPLSPDQACSIIRQALTGVKHAHDAGVVHRDIKPSNLMIDSVGVVKVLDLGLATILQGSSEESLTQTGAFLGTPNYVAPEQALNAAVSDARADLYSIGCTLFFLLYGRAPLGQGMADSRKENFSPPSALGQPIPAKLNQILKRLLAPLPQDRYQTAEEVTEALDRFLHRKQHTRRNTLVFLTVALLAGIYLTVGRPADIVQSDPQNDTFSRQSGIEQLHVFVRREAGVEQHLVVDQSEHTTTHIQPIKSTLPNPDAIRIEGRVTGRERTFLFWFDTRGEVETWEIGNPEGRIAYPSGEDQMVTVSPKDPPGTHLWVFASIVDDNVNISHVQSLLRRLGKPPEALQGPAFRIRGSGETVTMPTSHREEYLKSIRDALPSGWKLHLALPFVCEQ